MSSSSTSSNSPQTIDRFTRNYSIALAAIALFAAVWWLIHLDYRAIALNQLLAEDKQLATYPYSFKVLAVNNGTAQMSTPRSAQLSAIQALRIIHPELQNQSATSDAMMAAQQELARLQSHAAKLIKSQEDIQRVRWVLDRHWLESHGVMIQ